MSADADDTKRYLHISEIAHLSDDDWAKLDADASANSSAAAGTNGPMLQYLGTVTRSQVDSAISLESLQTALGAIESLYPKKRIAAYMKMNTLTRDALLTRIRPCEIDTDDMPTEQCIALRFGGVEIRIEGALPNGLVRIYNSADGLIEGCWL